MCESEGARERRERAGKGRLMEEREGAEVGVSSTAFLLLALGPGP